MCNNLSWSSDFKMTYILLLDLVRQLLNYSIQLCKVHDTYKHGV